MPQSPRVTRENKPTISINLLCGILLIRLKLFRGLQSGKCWKLVMEDPWPVLGFSFMPSHCRKPPHVSCQVPVAPGRQQGDARPRGLCVEAANTLPAFPFFTSERFSSCSVSGGLPGGVFLPWGSCRTPLQGRWGYSSGPAGPVEPRGAPLLAGLDGLVSLTVEMF